MSADAADVPPAVVDPRVMRDVLGHFVSGVTVVTAMGADGPLGFTCQSFSSLSLDPPLVAFAPARTSTTWPRLREAGRFCVNVLAEEQSDLSRQFARSGTDKFAGVSWAPSPH
ncbi:MAG TPA: flavin reductase family protein, partial [Modestobacter sp.]|nr:flavin reductase family protein [Modestobacter sp.]